MNSLQIFENTEFGKLGILVIDGKEYFPATDSARILGYGNPHDAVLRHCRGLVKHEVPTSGGPQEFNFISEGDLYRLIVRSNLPQAERFERWVFEEVLPAIRRHGAYMTREVVELTLSDPDYIIGVAMALKAEKEKSRALEIENAKQKQQICELQPKASYYDLILQNQSLVPISMIAKDYGMSGRSFNALLHELGIQYRMGDTWLLYQKFAVQGYTQSKTHAIDAERSVMHTYWTQKGRLFLYDLLKNSRSLLPVIERDNSISA